MTNEHKLRKIKEWQDCPLTVDLLCPLEKSHTFLKGAVVDGNVIMNCPNCDYTAQPSNDFFRDDILGQAVS